MPTKLLCSIAECGKPSYSRGWCNMHYRRWQRHGNPLTGKFYLGEKLRFINEVAVYYDKNDCLIWPFKTRGSAAGYGSFQLNGKSHNAHRFICKTVHGEPPTEVHQTAHNCGNDRCINPRHLRWATPKENCADIIRHGRIRRGANHYKTKLQESDVIKIRNMFSDGLSNFKIAKQFAVNEGTIRSIRIGKSWGWL